ncbi:MAG: hypothetical protein ACRCYQ_06985 [Nocardioides sp.]
MEGLAPADGEPDEDGEAAEDGEAEDGDAVVDAAACRESWEDSSWLRSVSPVASRLAAKATRRTPASRINARPGLGDDRRGGATVGAAPGVSVAVPAGETLMPDGAGGGAFSVVVERTIWAIVSALDCPRAISSQRS